jgi:hypothetical protein
MEAAAHVGSAVHGSAQCRVCEQVRGIECRRAPDHSLTMPATTVDVAHVVRYRVHKDRPSRARLYNRDEPFQYRAGHRPGSLRERRPSSCVSCSTRLVRSSPATRPPAVSIAVNRLHGLVDWTRCSCSPIPGASMSRQPSGSPQRRTWPQCAAANRQRAVVRPRGGDTAYHSRQTMRA